MPRFEPFPAVRYDPSRVALDDVIAPPYDVIDAAGEAELAARSPYNAVHVELTSGPGGVNRYHEAHCRFEEWMAEGVLRQDAEPAFYIYRMGYQGSDGALRQTTGVLGALELSPFGSGGVLPHERTMPKAKDDRLQLLRACRVNMSPIWALSLASGLSDLCQPAGPPQARATAADGVHHRVWTVTQSGLMETIQATVASAPAMIADGHHRYETALAYRDERRAAGDGAGDHDFVLTYMVELADDQLSVGPIHRVIAGLDDGFDPLTGLASEFELIEQVAPGPDVAERAAATGAVALVTATGAWLLRPTDGTTGDEPDSVRLDRALAEWPSHRIGFEHSPATVLGAVAAGDAQIGVLLRPATVAQIAAAARAGHRLPEKTTFFWPKPATGLTFRRV
ncbi:MAG: DUF1015 domain-containing protein [Actinomycetota bacterium]|nr:DUF1015 domain-containing protein [Actinomycetota bacterium]